MQVDIFLFGACRAWRSGFLLQKLWCATIKFINFTNNKHVAMNIYNEGLLLKHGHKVHSIWRRIVGRHWFLSLFFPDGLVSKTTASSSSHLHHINRSHGRCGPVANWPNPRLSRRGRSHFTFKWEACLEFHSPYVQENRFENGHRTLGFAVQGRKPRNKT